MSLADTLIQEAWSNAVGPAVKLYPGRIPQGMQDKYPNAGYFVTGFNDDEGPTSQRLEIERYTVSIAHTNKRSVRKMGRALRDAVEALDHENLADASAKLGDYAIPAGQAGVPLYWELTVEITLSLWDQED